MWWFFLFRFLWPIWFLRYLHDINLLLLFSFLLILSIVLIHLWLLWSVHVVLHVVMGLLLCVLFLLPVLVSDLHLLLLSFLLLFLFPSLVFQSVYFLFDFNCESGRERGWGLLRLKAIVNEEAFDCTILSWGEVLTIEVGCLSTHLGPSGSI